MYPQPAIPAPPVSAYVICHMYHPTNFYDETRDHVDADEISRHPEEYFDISIIEGHEALHHLPPLAVLHSNGDLVRIVCLARHTTPTQDQKLPSRPSASYTTCTPNKTGRDPIHHIRYIYYLH